MATKRKKRKTKRELIGPPLDLPPAVPEDIEPQRLLFDPGNLRLLERDRRLLKTKAMQIGQPALQQRIEEILEASKSFDVKSLATSIANNGFLRHERLIVVRYDGERYLVVEGNRRLAAVRFIIANYEGKELAPAVWASLRKLPCHLLEGDPIVDLTQGKRAKSAAERRLTKYRRVTAVYVGLRHLLGAKNWEPASRYEFQAELILEEGWTLSQVANRFGRSITAVRRDLQAQVLYRDFTEWERRHQKSHELTYNAFSEAVRSRSIKKWLGWSDTDKEIVNKPAEEAFFYFIASRFPEVSDKRIDEEQEEPPSIEKAVRHLKDMLDLDDPDIKEALDAREFETADALFEQRKEGKFAKRVKSYVRGLRNATSAELQEGARENRARLDELIEQAQAVRAQVLGYLGAK